jgi:hypothetical protein
MLCTRTPRDSPDFDFQRGPRRSGSPVLCIALTAFGGAEGAVPGQQMEVPRQFALLSESEQMLSEGEQSRKSV